MKMTIKHLLAAALFGGLALIATIARAADPLPSWNDGPAKQAIVDFLRATTTRGSPAYVPPAERIATFDQDGTLWVEHPVYSQLMYCFARVPAVVAEKPELKEVEPFKTVLSGDREAIAKLTMPDLEKIAVVTLNFKLAAYDNVCTPRNGPDWQVQFQIQFLLPKALFTKE